MKHLLLLILMLSIIKQGNSQIYGKVPGNLSGIRVVMVPAVFSVPLRPLNQNAGLLRFASPSPTEQITGTTTFDLQTNASIPNRSHYSDGSGMTTLTWNYSNSSSPGFTDRGTGYNYGDKNSFGTYPVMSIESVPSGWPACFPLGETGEGFISHNGISGLLVYTRDPAGNGPWLPIDTLEGPLCSDSRTALLWPAAISRGNTIHLLACTAQSEDGSPVYYQGMSAALLYYRSEDGGQSWTSPSLLPGMDSSSIISNVCKGFTGDAYCWANPVGDTLAFVAGGFWSDLFMMKSTDGGHSWTRKMIYSFPEITSAPTPVIPCSDGSLSICLDAGGQAHVVFGRMRVSDDDLSDDTAYYYPYTDGIVYWNETMAPLDSGVLFNDSILVVRQQLVAGVLDLNGNSVIDFPSVAADALPFGEYYLSLSSMPQLRINEYGELLLLYSSLNESRVAPGAYPDKQVFRDIFLKKGIIDQSLTHWDDGVCCLTCNSYHLFEECVFASLNIEDPSSIGIVFQTDEEPGLSLNGDMDPLGLNSINYLNLTSSDYNFCSYGIRQNENVHKFALVPNPTSGDVWLNVDLQIASDISIRICNLTGQDLGHFSFDEVSAGKHSLRLPTQSLQPGSYFITIQTATDSAVIKAIRL